ncbi:MAG: dephospho-CoA kinase [Bacteroidales bacterium]|nr:dephospho-CoA kinase [Bacteroidales bacterium]
MNPAQIEVMNMMSFVNTQSSWQRIKDALADYFAKQLDEEVSHLWENGTLNEEKVQSFSELHERTPYK